jgi:hypothetical protein
MGTLHLTVGASELYPNPGGNGEQTARLDLRNTAPVLDPTGWTYGATAPVPDPTSSADSPCRVSVAYGARKVGPYSDTRVLEGQY